MKKNKIPQQYYYNCRNEDILTFNLLKKAKLLQAIKQATLQQNRSLKNRHALMCCPSRRNTTSHKMVASEPVTERFGPTSTPIKIALLISSGTFAACTAFPAINPAGRLFITLLINAMPAPLIHVVLTRDLLVLSSKNVFVKM